jgi:hypothetical protein
MDLSRREYRFRGWKKGLYLLPGGIMLAAGFLIGAIAALRSALAVGLVVALPFLVFGLYLLIWTLRCSVLIDSNRVEVRGAFLERTAALSDIEGFRMISSRYGSPAAANTSSLNPKRTRIALFMQI